jgi:fumarate hydratase class II
MRIERDAMGAVEIPDDALWGPQTQRAVENFPISGLRFGRRFIHALGHVKRACARANLELGLLPGALGDAIVRACDELIAGRWDDQFPIDVFQTGSGTSTNMNANEVIANRATVEPPGGDAGLGEVLVHPNDHVNMGQSSNDVIPTAIHVAATLALRDELIPALERLHEALDSKARAFDDVVKTGRTHLQDATPIRLGQVFGGYAAQARKGVERAGRAVEALRELPLGGTAVGTGLNRPVEFPRRAIAHVNQALGTDFVEAENHLEANAARDGIVEASGALRTVAVSLTKIANDVRWLGSGPRNGLGEIDLPAVQPGSSIMPGKVNPVMAEALILVAAQVVGHDAAITLCGLGGYFELNLMMPLLAYDLLRSIEWLANGTRAFTEGCVVGIEANREHCRAMVERSLALATALAPAIGYDEAAEIAKEAHRTGRTVREVAEEREALSAAELDAALDVRRMTEPGLPGEGETP